MPLVGKITPYSQSFAIMANELLSVEARNEQVAAHARFIIEDADEKNRRALGAVPPRTIMVNGHQDDTLSRIVPPDKGTIVVEYKLFEDVLAWILQTLRDRSPVVSGEYRDGHRLFADDIEVDDPAHPPLASRYTIFNVVPYARKLEIGKTKTGRDFVIQVPNLIYKRTAQDAKQRFGNVAKISSGFASATNAYRLKQNQATRSFRGGKLRTSARQRQDRMAGAAVTVPAIYVTLG